MHCEGSTLLTFLSKTVPIHAGHDHFALIILLVFILFVTAIVASAFSGESRPLRPPAATKRSRARVNWLRDRSDRARPNWLLIARDRAGRSNEPRHMRSRKSNR